MTYRLPETLRDNARERGDERALSLGDTTLTFAELDERSNRVATALARDGVGEGDRLALLDLNGLPFFEVLFGAVKLGAILCPVNFRLASREVAQIIEDAEAKVLFAGTRFLDVVDDADLADDHRVVVLTTPGDDAPGDDGLAYADWIGDAAADDPGFVGEDETQVLQLYTSGTTGLPKGVVLVNRNFATLQGPLARRWEVGPDTNALVAMPLFHIGGIGWALIPLIEGAHDVVVPEIDPPALLDTLEQERITNAFLVPAVLDGLAKIEGSGERDWSALRSLVYGASPITVAALRRVLDTFGCPMFQVYGLTETCGAVVMLDPDDHDPGGPREHLLEAAGKPVEGVELRIVDPDEGDVLDTGETGEIQMRSDAITPGYHGRPEETEEAFTEDGWFRTGDAGYRDDEGYVFITDRIKDMIVSGGENIYPIEVEQVLAEHDAVEDVAVIGVPHEEWGETVKAVVVLSEPVDEQELIDFVAGEIASYKKPTSVDVVDELPRNATGKLLKKELRAPYWEGVDRDVS